MQEEIQANIDKEEEKCQKMKELQRAKSDNPASQANYFFEKGKMIEKELKESRVKMDMAKGKEESEVKGESTLIL